MILAHWCVFIAFLLPYVFVVAAKINAPGMNNFTPRDALAKIDGWKKRANWAHINAFEAFSPFAAAVIIAHNVGVDVFYINLLSIIFIFSRALHGVFYIYNKATLRSAAWFVGILSVIGLFVLSSLQ